MRSLKRSRYAPAANKGGKFLYAREELRQFRERQGIGTIGEGCRRIVVSFKEQAVDTGCNTCPGKRFYELRLPTARVT